MRSVSVKTILLKIATAVAAVVFCHGLFANGYPEQWIGCDMDPADEGVFLEYLGDEMFCYRFKVRCD